MIPKAEHLAGKKVHSGTGHRPAKLGGEWLMNGPVSAGLRTAILDFLIADRPDEVISGMAIGFDMIWAEEALALGIPVTAALPCVGQETRWRPEQISRYRRILANPKVTTVVCAPGEYSVHMMLNRDHWLVDHTSRPDGKLLACWNGSSGGTRNTVVYARRKNLPVVYLKAANPEQTQWVVRS